MASASPHRSRCCRHSPPAVPGPQRRNRNGSLSPHTNDVGGPVTLLLAALLIVRRRFPLHRLPAQDAARIQPGVHRRSRTATAFAPPLTRNLATVPCRSHVLGPSERATRSISFPRRPVGPRAWVETRKHCAPWMRGRAMDNPASGCAWGDHAAVDKFRVAVSLAVKGSWQPRRRNSAAL